MPTPADMPKRLDGLTFAPPPRPREEREPTPRERKLEKRNAKARELVELGYPMAVMATCEWCETEFEVWVRRPKQKLPQYCIRHAKSKNRRVCPTPHKIKFETEERVVAYLARHKGEPDRPRLAYYRCHCHTWHLTRRLKWYPEPLKKKEQNE